jgi:hypothetical protein
MSLFNVNWRDVFNMALPPVERLSQTLDLGASLLSPLKTKSDELNDFFNESQTTVTNSCITMVLRELLNDRFGETTFEVQTNRGAIQVYLYDELESENVYFYDESESDTTYLVDESESVPNASITVRVPATVFSTQYNQVNEFVRVKKVAGKSYEIVSL